MSPSDYISLSTTLFILIFIACYYYRRYIIVLYQIYILQRPIQNQQPSVIVDNHILKIHYYDNHLEYHLAVPLNGPSRPIREQLFGITTDKEYQIRFPNGHTNLVSVTDLGFELIEKRDRFGEVITSYQGDEVPN